MTIQEWIDKRVENFSPCFSCDAWDSDYESCTISSPDQSYAKCYEEKKDEYRRQLEERAKKEGYL